MSNVTANATDNIIELRSITETSVQAFVLALISVTSVIGNAFVAAIIYFDRRLHKPTFYFIASLSFADFIVGAVYVPFYAVAVVKQEWQLSSTWCKGHAATISLSLNASLITLGFVSLDRFLAITKPLRYQTLLTTTRATILIALGWVHSVFWAATPLVGWGEIVHDPRTSTCRPNWAAKGLASRVYAMLLALFAFTVPSVTMIYCYWKIFRVAKHHVKLIKQNSVTTSQNGVNSIKETRALKTVLLVLGAFVIAWLPYTIVSLSKLFTKKHFGLESTAANAILTVTLINGCVNPVIYSLRDTRFKNGMKKLLFPCAKDTSQDFNSCVASVQRTVVGTVNSGAERYQSSTL